MTIRIGCQRAPGHGQESSAGPAEYHSQAVAGSISTGGQYTAASPCRAARRAASRQNGWSSPAARGRGSQWSQPNLNLPGSFRSAWP